MNIFVHVFWCPWVRVSLESILTNEEQGYKVYTSPILLSIDSLLIQRSHTILHQWTKVHIVPYCHQHLILSVFDFCQGRQVSMAISGLLMEVEHFSYYFMSHLHFFFVMCLTKFFDYFSIGLIHVIFFIDSYDCGLSFYYLYDVLPKLLIFM